MAPVRERIYVTIFNKGPDRAHEGWGRKRERERERERERGKEESSRTWYGNGKIWRVREGWRVRRWYRKRGITTDGKRADREKGGGYEDIEEEEEEEEKEEEDEKAERKRAKKKNKILAYRVAALRASQWLCTIFVGPWNDFQQAAKANAVSFYGVWSPFYADRPPPLLPSTPTVSIGPIVSPEEFFASAWFDQMFHHCPANRRARGRSKELSYDLHKPILNSSPTSWKSFCALVFRF